MSGLRDTAQAGPCADNAAVVPPGYKRTEVGVIPKDWRACRLGDDGLAKRVGSGITPTGGQRVYKRSGRPFVRSQNVGWGRLLLDDLAFIDDGTHSSFVASEIVEGDVLLNITGASIGRCAVATAALAGGNVNQHVCEIRTDPERLDPRFLCSLILSELGQKQIDSFQAGGNRQGLNFGQLRTFAIPLPLPPEQRAIAEALLDVDGLLGELEALIVKKRAIKQAAMQQLLTGKTRLPGFSGEWERRLLGDVATVSKGEQLSRDDVVDSGGYPHLNGGISPSGWARRFNVPGDTIAVSEGGNSCGFVQFMAEPYWCGGHCYSVLSRETDNRFLYHALKGRQAAIMALRVGSGLPNVQRSALLSLKISCPRSESEQIAIATVLSNMDAEIAALEARRDKTRAIRRGMMQQLLTGRVRLVDPSSTEAGA